MTWGEPAGLEPFIALVRHWLHQKESDDPAEFKREVTMALWLEKRAFQMMHPPEK